MIGWGPPALVLAALSAAPMLPTLRGREGVGEPAVAALAAAATMFVSAAVPLELHRFTLTAAWALEVAALAWIGARLRVPLLRPLAGALGALVLVRLLLNPALAGYDPGPLPVLNWLLYGYGVPALAFALAAWLWRKEGATWWDDGAELAAVALTLALLALQVRHWFHFVGASVPEEGVVRWLGAGFEVAEWGAIIVLWLLLGLALLWAFPVLLMTGIGRAADTSGPKIMHEPEQKKVKFVDEKGHAFKDISLAQEKTKVNVKDADGERVIRKDAAVSASKKFVVFVKNQTTHAITSEQLQERQGRGGEPVGPADFITEMGGTVMLYDAFGNVMFEQSVPENTVVSPRFVVSNSGTVALISEGRLDDPDREDKLLVYDQGGMELLVYPRPEESGFVPLDISRLSANGRYLAAKVNFDQRPPSPG